MSANRTAMSPHSHSQPWASGRVLTQEQRKRKREVNRKSARALKESLQDQVSQLQARLSKLEQRNCQCDPSVLQEESSFQPINFNTAQTFPSMPEPNQGSPGGVAWMTPPPLVGHEAVSLTRQQGNDNASTTSGDFDGRVDPMDQQIAAYSFEFNPADQQSGGGSETTSTFSAGGNKMDSNWMMLAQDSDASTPLRAPTRLRPPDPWTAVSEAISKLNRPELQQYLPLHVQKSASELSNDSKLTNKILNNLIGYYEELVADDVCFDDTCNKDFLIRAIVNGFLPTFQRYERICPIWIALHFVDQWLFIQCNFIERISMLRMIHLKVIDEMLSRTGEQHPLPPWYKHGQYHSIIQHDAVIDFIAWPSMRDSLTLLGMPSSSDPNPSIISPILTNRFWLNFASSFRFSWSREPFAALSFSQTTSEYDLSPAFEIALFNIDNWCMDPKFHVAYPQLARGIRPANYMPLTRTLPTLGVRGLIQRRRLIDGEQQSLVEG